MSTAAREWSRHHRLVTDGPERDGATIWAGEIRQRAQAAKAPMRRCVTPGCYAITAELRCQKCGATIAEPEPDHRAEFFALAPIVKEGRYQPVRCLDCPTVFTPRSGNQARCVPCAQKAQERMLRESKARRMHRDGRPALAIAAVLGMTLEEVRVAIRKGGR